MVKENEFEDAIKMEIETIITPAERIKPLYQNLFTYIFKKKKSHGIISKGKSFIKFLAVSN